MATTRYTNRELDQLFKSFNEREDDRHTALLTHMKGFEQATAAELREIKEDGKETKAQAQKTNGRVSSLENWKWALIGAWAVLTVIIIPMIAAYISSGKI